MRPLPFTTAGTRQKLASLGGNKKVLLYLLAGMNFTHIVDFMIIMPLGDQFMRLFSITPGQFAIIVSAYTFSAGISSFLASFFIDRFNRKTALLVVYTGFTLGTLSVALANSYYTVVLARILTGLFGGMISALVLSIVSDLYTFKERGTAMGILTAAFSAASVLGVPLGLLLASQFVWHAPFIFLGSIGVILSVLIFFIFPQMTEHRSERPPAKPWQVLGNIFSDKNQVLALLLGAVIILGQFVVIPFIAPYFIRNIGFNELSISLMYMVGGAATLFSSPWIGRITDRFGPLRVFLVMLFISFVPVLVLTHLPPVPMALALFVSMMLFVTVSGRMVPVQTMTTAAVRPETRASFMSIKSSFQQLAAGAASFISGMIVVESSPDGPLENYAWVGYLSVGITLLALLLAPRLKVAPGN